MFEMAELGQEVDKATYRARLPALREQLLDAQLRLRDADFAVAIVIAGVEGAGKGDTVNALLEWFDARGIRTHALGRPSALEEARPRYYRFWERLPPKGSIGIFLGSWYTFPIIDRTFDRMDEGRFEVELRRVNEFERMLHREGVLILKFWLHMTESEQRSRFEKLEADPDKAWRVNERDWAFHRLYKKFASTCTRALRLTSSGHAPWTIVEAHDKRYRNLRVAEHVLERVEQRLARPPPPPPDPPVLPVPAPVNVLRSLDLSKKLERPAYAEQRGRLQARLARLARRLFDAGRSVVLVFEGQDAAGKGGAIRRLTQALDARFYAVIPISAPSDEERALPYLWRFWRHVPRVGYVVIFDRSWYGRMLVERIEGFCRPEAWQRAHREINAFEEHLKDAGTLVIKFWLQIDAEEQLRRFEAREATGYKRHKLTEEDWRNREKWDAYEAAVCDMLEKTSTEEAPWVLVEANDKYFARVKVLRTLCDRLEAELGPEPEPPAPKKKGKKKTKKKKKGKKG